MAIFKATGNPYFGEGVGPEGDVVSAGGGSGLGLFDVPGLEGLIQGAGGSGDDISHGRIKAADFDAFMAKNGYTPHEEYRDGMTIRYVLDRNGQLVGTPTGAPKDTWGEIAIPFIAAATGGIGAAYGGAAGLGSSMYGLSGAAAGAAGGATLGAGAGAANALANDQNVFQGALKGGVMGGIGGYAGSAFGPDPYELAAQEALNTSGNYYVGNNAAGIDAFSNQLLGEIPQNASVGTTGVNYGNEGLNYPTPESTQGIGGSPVNATTADPAAPTSVNLGEATPPTDTSSLPNAPTTPVSQNSNLDAFTKWASNNPLQAVQLASLVGGKLFGNNGNDAAQGGLGSLGSQANMTATPAQALQRQYVAPTAGYRPGFDPEHRYFTGIGAVGSGQAGTQDQTTPQNRA